MPEGKRRSREAIDCRGIGKVTHPGKIKLNQNTHATNAATFNCSITRATYRKRKRVRRNVGVSVLLYCAEAQRSMGSITTPVRGTPAFVAINKTASDDRKERARRRARPRGTRVWTRSANQCAPGQLIACQYLLEAAGRYSSSISKR